MSTPSYAQGSFDFPAILAQVRAPFKLVGSTPSVPAGDSGHAPGLLSRIGLGPGVPSWAIWGGAAILVAVVMCGIVWFVFRLMRGRAARGRRWWTVARALGLDRAACELIGRVAAIATLQEPVAMLMTRSVFAFAGHAAWDTLSPRERERLDAIAVTLGWKGLGAPKRSVGVPTGRAARVGVGGSIGTKSMVEPKPVSRPRASDKAEGVPKKSADARATRQSSVARRPGAGPGERRLTA